jgi:hypothetical protein
LIDNWARLSSVVTVPPTFVPGPDILCSLPARIHLVVAAPELGRSAAEVTAAVVAVLAGHVQPFEDHIGQPGATQDGWLGREGVRRMGVRLSRAGSKEARKGVKNSERS